MCGIYKYENLINHKCYIGQSIDIKKRQREHKNASFNPKHSDYDLAIHCAIRKYGLENFSIEILEECEKDRLNELEVKWIKHYDSYKNGYNETEGGDESHIHLGKPVELYNMEGNYIIEYPNITEAAKALGVYRGTIYQVLYGKRLSTKGYQFKLKEDTSTTISIYKNRQGGKKPIRQIDKNTLQTIKIWESSYEASRELGFDASSITKCAKGKLKSVGGFNWKYVKEE